MQSRIRIHRMFHPAGLAPAGRGACAWTRGRLASFAPHLHDIDGTQYRQHLRGTSRGARPHGG